MILALVLLAWILGASDASAATFVVNSAADGDDGVCDVDGCTLREAIIAANTQPGRDQILFLVRPLDGKVKTIQPLSQLPLLSDPAGAVVNALTQTGSRANSRSDGTSDAVLVVELDGSFAGSPVHGLVVTGGPATIEGLVINRFAGSGILLAGGQGHVVANNFIGTDVNGMAGARNADDGVTVLASDVRVGRGADGQNVLSGNAREGVQVNGQAERVAIEGNLIGMAADGLPRLGNSRAGVSLWTAFNRIGGFASGTGNHIGGNGDAGVVLLTEEAHDNVVQGNSIFANHSHGVMITVDAGRNLVGRPGGFPSPSNSIVGNGGNGICITAAAGTPNTTLPFEVRGNELIGIDFTGGDEDEFGITPNDPFDADTGPNGLQNSPVLLAASYAETGTLVEGLFPGDPEEDLLVSFYAGDACHRSGHGDGRIVAGDLVIRTDASGESQGRTRIAAPLGQFVSAIAVDLDGNSSELSNCVQVVIAPTPTLTATVGPTETPDPFAPTATPTSVPTSTSEPTSTATITETPTPEPTETPVPSETPTAPETPTPTPVRTPGDANCDDAVTAADAIEIGRQIAAAELRCGADVDGDQSLSAADLTSLPVLLFR